MKAYKVYYYNHDYKEYAIHFGLDLYKNDIIAANDEEEAKVKFKELRGVNPTGIVEMDISYEQLVEDMVKASKLSKKDEKRA